MTAGASAKNDTTYLVAVSTGFTRGTINYAQTREQAEKLVKDFVQYDVILPKTVYCEIHTEKYHLYIEQKRVVRKKGKTKYRRIKLKK